VDWRATVLLPKTSFPMRAGLPQQEPARLEAWQRQKVYERLRSMRRGRRRFVLHDGPPYANGEIHMGTALNKILKDMINRFRVLEGDDVVFVPGYDTHGLPIEMQTLKSLNVSQHELDPVALRRVCYDTAVHYMAVMSRQFQRLGVLGDWDRAYATLDPRFEAEELRLFARLVARGLIYKDRKAVYWCPICETALAEAEIEYREHVSPSIYVAFPVVADPRALLPQGTRAVIWTTTPWTLPANVAIAYHPAFRYVVAKTDVGPLLLAEDLLDAFQAATGLRVTGWMATLDGDQLAGIEARHPWLERTVPLVAAEYVTREQGTGLVHTAPGHGVEDFDTGRRYGLPVVQPLDDQGRFEAATPEVGGLFYADANAVVIELLRRKGALLAAGEVRHQYPHCWRCKEPVIFRATAQWFMRLDPIRTALLQAADGVEWVPGWGRERMRQMIVDRQDWCLSRQRNWGLPIPALRCGQCGAPYMDEAFVMHVADLVEQHGSGIWWEWPVDRLLPDPVPACPACGAHDWEREYNVFDVWMDSGATQSAVLRSDPELAWPCDVVLEGNDQFRGWFNALLTTAVGAYDAAPYRRVVAHGWVLDGEGRPMHKSLGNVLDPFELVERHGADVLRLWVAGSDFRGDVRVSSAHVEQIAEQYRKIRNTFRFLLGNLFDFRPEDACPPEALDPLDRWALYRLGGLMAQVRAAYADQQFHTVITRLVQFVVNDLSGFYLDVIKDRLYTLAPAHDKRRATQTVLWWTAQQLVRAVMPVLPFTADEIWRYIPGVAEDSSVLWAEWEPLPDAASVLGPGELVERLWPLREAALPALEEARQAKVIGNSLEADLFVSGPADIAAVVRDAYPLALEMLMVARIQVADEPTPDLRVQARRTPFVKCPRCWRHVERLEAEGICARCADTVRA
jgi:isoleucyl-tRNA synthetase